MRSISRLVRQPSELPTWNYAVGMRAARRACCRPRTYTSLLDACRGVRTEPARGEAMESLPSDFTTKILEAIVGFRIAVEELVGKFKLSQNRRREDVEGVAAALEAEGQEALAELMRAHAARPAESR